MKNVLKLTLFIATILIFLSACQNNDIDSATGQDVTVLDLAVSDVFTFSNSETDNAKFDGDSTSSCYTTRTTLNSDGTFTTTISFDGSCVMKDGISRSGEIIITWQPGWRLDSTKKATVTFNQFTRDSALLNGNIEISVKTTVPVEYTIVENDMSLKLKTGETITWSGVRNVKWENGFITRLDRSDDVRLINYERNGINRNGESFTAIGQDLRIDNSCGDGLKAHVVSGTIVITNHTQNETVTVVDFGDGECDDSFTISQNGVTIEVNQ